MTCECDMKHWYYNNDMTLALYTDCWSLFLYFWLASDTFSAGSVPIQTKFVISLFSVPNLWMLFEIIEDSLPKGWWKRTLCWMDRQSYRYTSHSFSPCWRPKRFVLFTWDIVESSPLDSGMDCWDNLGSFDPAPLYLEATCRCSWEVGRPGVVLTGRPTVLGGPTTENKIYEAVQVFFKVSQGCTSFYTSFTRQNKFYKAEYVLQGCTSSAYKAGLVFNTRLYKFYRLHKVSKALKVLGTSITRMYAVSQKKLDLLAWDQLRRSNFFWDTMYVCNYTGNSKDHRHIVSLLFMEFMLL